MTDTEAGRVYRVSWGWRLFFAVSGPGLVAVLVFGMNESFSDPAASQSQRTTVVVLLVAFALLAVACLTFAFRGAVVLSEQGLRYRGLFGAREIAWKDLAGFRVPPRESRALCILVGRDGKKKLTVPDTFQRSPEILQELSRHMPDLDLAEARKENEALESQRQFQARFGKAPADLATIKRLCQAVNVAAFVLLVSGLVLHPGRFAAPWTAVFVIASLLPAPAALYLKHRFGDAVSLDTKRGSDRASLEYGLFAGLLAPVPAAIFDFAPVASGRIWMLGLFPATAIALALFAAVPNFRERRFLAAVMLAICAAFGYGAAASANGGFDSSPVVLRATKVLRLIEERYTNDVAVAPFEGVLSEQTISVGADVFRRLSVGDAVLVAVRRGALGAPWIAGLRTASAALPASP